MENQVFCAKKACFQKRSSLLGEVSPSAELNSQSAGPLTLPKVPHGNFSLVLYTFRTKFIARGILHRKLDVMAPWHILIVRRKNSFCSM